MSKHIALALTLCLSALAHADSGQSRQLHALQSLWAQANYNPDEKVQAALFETLVQRAEQAKTEHPDAADLLIWDGIIKSSYAGIKGGLGALGLVKEARADFERALELEPDALNGSAYTSLGFLYARVPGWPVAFGDDKKAGKLLRKGLEINPDGIDSNYFYGLYLLDHKQFEQARQHLEKARRAAPRPEREHADAGRRLEIDLELEKLQQTLASH